MPSFLLRTKDKSNSELACVSQKEILGSVHNKHCIKFQRGNLSSMDEQQRLLKQSEPARKAALTVLMVHTAMSGNGPVTSNCVDLLSSWSSGELMTEQGGRST